MIGMQKPEVMVINSNHESLQMDIFMNGNKFKQWDQLKCSCAVKPALDGQARSEKNGC